MIWQDKENVNLSLDPVVVQLFWPLCKLDLLDARSSTRLLHSQHRAIKWFGLAGIFKDHIVQPPLPYSSQDSSVRLLFYLQITTQFCWLVYVGFFCTQRSFHESSGRFWDSLLKAVCMLVHVRTLYNAHMCIMGDLMCGSALTLFW